MPLYSRFHFEFAMTRFYQLAVLLILGVAANAEDPDRIVGGSIAAPGEFPYQASIRINGQHFCGASIIDATHILTAAHCVKGVAYPPYSMIKIVTGTNSMYSGGQSHSVRAVYYHGGYIGSHQASWVNDIAVIVLAAPIRFNAYQKPIRLPSRDTPGNTPAVLSGWGMTRANGPLSPQLKKAYMTIESNHVCQSTHKERIYSSQLCAIGSYGTGGCQGDSGGPLVANGEQVGVVSWVYPCALGYSDVYTRVYHHLSFINEVRGRA